MHPEVRCCDEDELSVPDIVELDISDFESDSDQEFSFYNASGSRFERSTKDSPWSPESFPDGIS